MTDQGESDLAAVLTAEFHAWFQNLGPNGVIPRVFTGVTADGKQAIVILTGLLLDHVQRREFLIWLCRCEQFVAYAYGTHVGIATDSTSDITEGISIYASSERYNVSQTLDVEKLADGSYKLSGRSYTVSESNSENDLFHGLQRSTDNISSDQQTLFRKLWMGTKAKAMWRQRPSYQI
jgi:hypothetical protein